MIYISAGHHHEKRGACYKGFCEHEEAKVWQSLLANMLGHDGMVVPCGILRHKVKFINERASRQDIAIEIHFNSAVNNNGEHIGKGSETLYYPNSERGYQLAQLVQDELGIIYNPDRGAKEGYYRMDKSRGVDFFLERTICTALIIEPDFIHRKNIIQSKRAEGCKSIVNALRGM